MSWLLDKLTGRAGKVFPDWEGEVLDARCRFHDITFDADRSVLNIRCWRLKTAEMLAEDVYEELLIVFDGLTCPPNINREEDLSYYELSAIYFDPKDRQVCIWFHAGLSIIFPASSPNFSFRDPTGEKRQSKELFTQG